MDVVAYHRQLLERTAAKIVISEEEELGNTTPPGQLKALFFENNVGPGRTEDQNDTEAAPIPPALTA
ncbi:hypothetical protein J6590_086622 [Homalodisca vitripennis]|nr:hypothetical protein J6590_086622 [Homalodisca vitripennis]